MLIIGGLVSKTVLFVIPHEDDGEGGGGGSAAMWSSQGDRVVFLLCTNGDKGTSDCSMTPKKLAKIRNREQIEAASILGVKEVVFLDYGDGELEDTMELRGKITRQIRIYQPDIVLAIDPFRRKVHQHRDHRVSGMATLDSVFTYAWTSQHFPDQIKDEGLSPHHVREIFLWNSENANIILDISDTIGLKIQALSKHVSQIHDMDRMSTNVQERARRIVENYDYEFGEAFRRIVIEKEAHKLGIY